MAKKSGPLAYLQYMFPTLVVVVILNSVALSWLGSLEQNKAWAELVPLLAGLVSLLGVAAGGGPLMADQIKAKAGVLASSGEGK